MENLSLIVGLGNPGIEYARTRHNVGFMAAEELALRSNATWQFEKRYNARIARIEKDGRKMLVCEPQTFMNASGESVAALTNYFRIPFDRMVIAVDDADLPFGEIRLRPKGSSGGHHGLESIMTHLGTQEFARLRIGIGRAQAEQREITNYVLGEFVAAELDLLRKVLSRAADQINCWWTGGIEMAMSHFNGRGPLEQEKNK